jgi:uncharacterized peroxidase-related enzyme
MAWIKTIAPSDARGDLADLYKRVKNPDGTVDNVMQIHALHTATLHAHFEMYVTSMHRTSPLSKGERELVGTIVSALNGCEYCRRHHAAGLRRHLPDDRKPIADALANGEINADTLRLTDRERAMCDYATRLTLHPSSIREKDVSALKLAGLDDRAILDLACVVGYFCYVNRIVLGLGVAIESFPLGQHPSDPED